MSGVVLNLSVSFLIICANLSLAHNNIERSFMHRKTLKNWDWAGKKAASDFKLV